VIDDGGYGICGDREDNRMHSTTLVCGGSRLEVRCVQDWVVASVMKMIRGHQRSTGNELNGKNKNSKGITKSTQDTQI
jgi:hypothetical protein